MQAIIGITTYARDEKTVVSEGLEAFFALPADYVDAVRRAGGVPVLLPPGEVDLGTWVGLCDGFIFSGGCDIEPSHYGGAKEHPKLGKVSAERDQTELTLLDLLLKNDKPVLMICRGLQLLNIARGGTLHAHIADVRPENIHQGKDTIWTLQEVQIRTGQRLTGMSGHHQGVKDLGADLQVEATADDGIVEAISHKKHPHCIAVQWHPEMTAASDQLQQSYFDRLVAESRKSP